MTTGSNTTVDPAQGQEQLPAGQTAAQTPPAEAGAQNGNEGVGSATLTFTHPQPADDDPDAAELRDAQAAAKAEEAGGEGEGEAGATNGQQPPPHTGEGTKPGTAPAAGQQPAQQGQQPTDQVMIPKPRVDALAKRAYTAEQRVAYLEGMIAARQPAGQAGQEGAPQHGQQQPAPPTIEQRLATVQQKQDALAQKFDEGEISMKDYVAQSRTLENEVETIREERLTEKLKPATAPAPASGSLESLRLDELTTQIEQAHPWTVTLTEYADKTGSEAEWRYLTQLAVDNLKSRGVDPKNGELGKFQLRKEIAELATKYGPSLVGDKLAALGIASPGQQQPSQGQQQQQQQQPPDLSKTAAARTAKLALANAAPPDLTRLPGQGDDPTMPTDARIEAMSDEEIAALPAPVRNRILGAT
jgi:hypothetical protein